MAEEKTANTAVPNQGDHDRVAMLSVRADGTPDQHNPEIIGDKDFAVAATKRQFAEQAVSAADVQRRDAAAADTAAAETVDQDPSIEKAQKQDDKLSTAAEKQAEKVVGELHQG